MSRARGRRSKHRYRKRGEELELERAFSEAWAQRAWDPAQHTTPMGLCFPTTEAWRSWLARVQERYPRLDLLTLACCPPVVAVIFQHRSGGWLEAPVIDEMVMLTRSGRAGRRRRARAHQNEPNEAEP